MVDIKSPSINSLLLISYSTAHTDSDADCENSKNHPRKSKPDKKKKRTTNLGPRVRVMNSTAITDEKEEVTEVKLECHLEVKTEDSCGKTLTFEFSYPDVDPVEISQEFVSIRIIKNRYVYIIKISSECITFFGCLLIFVYSG